MVVVRYGTNYELRVTNYLNWRRRMEDARLFDVCGGWSCWIGWAKLWEESLNWVKHSDGRKDIISRDARVLRPQVRRDERLRELDQSRNAREDDRTRSDRSP